MLQLYHAALYHQTTPSTLFPFSNNPQLQNVSQLCLMKQDMQYAVIDQLCNNCAEIVQQLCSRYAAVMQQLCSSYEAVCNNTIFIIFGPFSSTYYPQIDLCFTYSNYEMLQLQLICCKFAAVCIALSSNHFTKDPFLK